MKTTIVILIIETRERKIFISIDFYCWKFSRQERFFSFFFFENQFVSNHHQDLLHRIIRIYPINKYELDSKWLMCMCSNRNIDKIERSMYSLEMLLRLNQEEMFGILNIHGHMNFAHVPMTWNNVKTFLSGRKKKDLELKFISRLFCILLSMLFRM